VGRLGGAGQTSWPFFFPLNLFVAISKFKEAIDNVTAVNKKYEMTNPVKVLIPLI